MKTGCMAIVVLFVIAHSPAYGQDPGSEGAQCVYDCVWPNATDKSAARSGFQKVVQRRAASDEDTCTNFEKKMACVERCQVGKYVILARKLSRIWEKYCGDNANEATTREFAAENDRLLIVWTAEVKKCDKNYTTPEDDCMLASDCIFGSALASARKGFSEDVVAVKVFLNKISYGAAVEVAYGVSLPSSCNLLFEPTVPEPPYPYAPYQPEPYEPEPYPYESYQRNPYQRNPYQSNPYQRNPYQRNPYQRNPYQRNPYKRRH